MLAGDFDGAETLMRQGYDVLEAMGENACGSTGRASSPVHSSCRGGTTRPSASPRRACNSPSPSDLVTQILWRGVRARLLLARGDHEAAETNAREAVTIAEQTEFVNFHADALVDLAAVLGESPRAADAPPLMAEALALYRAKGNIVSADALHESLDSLAAV